MVASALLGAVFALLFHDDTIADAETACKDRLADAGYQRYEISAYARAGRVCRQQCGKDRKTLAGGR